MFKDVASENYEKLFPLHFIIGERGCSVEEPRAPEREVGGLKFTSTLLCA